MKILWHEIINIKIREFFSIKFPLKTLLQIKQILQNGRMKNQRKYRNGNKIYSKQALEISNRKIIVTNM